MRGLVAFGFHLMGETVFWFKSLCQLGFVCFFLVFIFGLGLDIFKIFNFQEGIIQNIINL
ncbi:hypothetical protein AZO1586I_2412 [Bathymodiolus thermophilus thioautotrophic gill symbiont]|uniref:Uncharacterized protein n=1 Tax=Bathymodiolus thermophilus thioautotrophic gill symbiont TaxID=2360 RepID=A0ABM8MBK5_9GAMM|nr:hypothetical protein AZO1586I_2412 [Bathymodiolus thermophilus thioautotrophic gill symbiont]